MNENKITKPEIQKVTGELQELYGKTAGTHKVCTLYDVKYIDIVEALGEPSITETSADDKVQVEWILEYNDNVYTIYDYKTYDREYTFNKLDHWSVGGKFGNESFIKELLSLFNKVTTL